MDFFGEKLQALEKKKHGTMDKVFSDHPPTPSRIVAVQREIQEHLKERPEYVVTTSEFNDVKAKLLAMHNRRPDEKIDPTSPPEPQARIGGSAGDGNSTGNSAALW